MAIASLPTVSTALRAAAPRTSSGANLGTCYRLTRCAPRKLLPLPIRGAYSIAPRRRLLLCQVYLLWLYYGSVY